MRPLFICSQMAPAIVLAASYLHNARQSFNIWSEGGYDRERTQHATRGLQVLLSGTRGSSALCTSLQGRVSASAKGFSLHWGQNSHCWYVSRLHVPLADDYEGAITFGVGSMATGMLGRDIFLTSCSARIKCQVNACTLQQLTVAHC